MKQIYISPKSTQKIQKGTRELSEKDLTELPKGLTPGEWVIFSDEQKKIDYLGYINLFSENFYKAKIVSILNPEDKKSNEEQLIQKTLELKINQAVRKRALFDDYKNGHRLIYGMNDSLPGIIVDKYKKYVLVQINTAGMDKYREYIYQLLTKLNPEQKVILFDNPEYRKAEVLPIHETTGLVEDLEIEENGLKYLIDKSVVQKIGYYYDHRENRRKISELIKRSNIEKESGIDLFSYVGSWGLHLLKAGIKNVDFVDQADMEEVTKRHLKMNGFEGRGVFTRADVFKHLDKLIENQKLYNVVISDPPAFTKSEKNKAQGLSGYEKLHGKCLKIVKDEGFFVAASCTHYVNFEELDKTVQDAASKSNVSIQLLDSGVQGFDHPMTGLSDKSFYIKYLVYLVNRG